MKNININFEKVGNSIRVVLLNNWTPSKNNKNYSEINGKLYLSCIYAGSFSKIQCFNEQGKAIIVEKKINI